MIPPDVIGPIMQGVLDCSAQALEDHGAKAKRILLAAGAEVAWDECCDGNEETGSGQLWVRLIEFYPTGPFPGREARPTNCSPVLMAASLGIGIIRCAHGMDSKGRAPKAEDLSADALRMTADASVLLEAIKCCIPGLKNVEKAAIQTWLPLGPEGGCVGGEWQVIVGLGTCACPEPE